MRTFFSGTSPVAPIGAALAIALAVVGLNAQDWPEWRGAGRFGVWHETGILETFPEAGLTVRWRTPIRAGYSGPAVSGGRVFVTDADVGPKLEVTERAVALDEATGRILWSHAWQTDYRGLEPVYAVGPRATPTVDGDMVYTVGAMGKLIAFEAATGRVAWEKDYVRELATAVPSWGIVGSPIVDGDLLICLVGGEPNAKVVAFDKRTGREVWRALSSDWEPGYAQLIRIESAGLQQLIVWHPRAISSLNPKTGEVYWEVPHEVDMGMTVPTAVWTGSQLLVSSLYNGARLVQVDTDRPGASLVWESEALSSVISTPVVQGDYIYGLSGGELRCLELATGRQVWTSRELLPEKGSASLSNVFFVRHEDRYFISTDHGHLVIARLSPEGYHEIDRTQLIEPTHPRGRARRDMPFIHWSHPAYANRHIVVRNDQEILRASLEADPNLP